MIRSLNHQLRILLAKDWNNIHNHKIIIILNKYFLCSEMWNLQHATLSSDTRNDFDLGLSDGEKKTNDGKNAPHEMLCFAFDQLLLFRMSTSSLPQNVVQFSNSSVIALHLWRAHHLFMWCHCFGAPYRSSPEAIISTAMRNN